MPSPEFSVVIPCLNEAQSLAICIQKAHTFFTSNRISYEIIVSDNGSSDGSEQIAIDNRARLVNEPEKGYGSALRAGIDASLGKYIIMGDADDSYDFSNLMPFVNLLREGYDLVMGDRFKGGIEKGAMPFLHRYLGNPVLSFLGRVFFKVRVKDFQCGLRGFSRVAYDKMDLRTMGMEFSTEMVVKAGLARLRIIETPITLYPDKRNRPPHLRTWRDGWRYLRFLLIYSPKWLFLLPGLFLMLLGLVGTVLLMAGPVPIGNKRLDVHTMVYTAAFVVLGFQFICFYVFSRLYAAVHGLWPGQQEFLGYFEKYFTLERGIIAGVCIFIGGLILGIRSFLYWERTHFGNLDPMVVLRWVIPSALLLMLGLQIITSFFYLSLITIKSKEKRGRQ